MKKTAFAAISLLICLVVCLSGKGFATENADNEHFTVQEVMYAFHGSKILCAFYATAGTSVNLDISCSADYPYEIVLQIASAQDTIFSTTVDGKLKIHLNINQSDFYNVTVSKRPFYSTVTMAGTIDVYNSSAPSPTLQLLTASVTDTIPEFPGTSLLVIAVLVGTTVPATLYKRRH